VKLSGQIAEQVLDIQDRELQNIAGGEMLLGCRSHALEHHRQILLVLFVAAREMELSFYFRTPLLRGRRNR
jgi:hypothetical protein